VTTIAPVEQLALARGAQRDVWGDRLATAVAAQASECSSSMRASGGASVDRCCKNFARSTGRPSTWICTSPDALRTHPAR